MKGTLTSKQRIGWLFENGKKFSSASFLALYSKAETPPQNNTQALSFEPKMPSGRIAFIAGKKLGNAPLRSRAKRRLREAVLTSAFSCGPYDIVLVARKGALSKSFDFLVKDIERLALFIREDEEMGGGAQQRKGAEKRGDKEPYKEPYKEPLRQNSNRKNQNTSFVHRFLSAIIGIPRTLALLCIKLYRHAISPLLPPSCRYVPTCSEYALIAFERFGFWKGLWLSVKRVGRCHPFAQGGYDPVPEK